MRLGLHLVIVLAFLVLYCGCSAASGTLGHKCDTVHEAVQCELMYVCLSGHCSKCQTDSQCTDMQPEYICQSDGECHHKNLFPAFSWRDGVGTLVLFVASLLSAAAGVGGGGIYVPILILTFSFGPHAAIPLSKATAFGTAFASFLVNLRKRHPIDHLRPLIDYDVAFVMEPSILMGGMVGVLLNAIFPGWLIVCLLFVILSWATWKTWTKGVVVWKQESKIRRSSGINTEKKSLLAKEKSDSDFSDLSVSNNSVNQQVNPELQKFILQSHNRFPWTRVLFLLAAWSFVILMAMFRGGHGSSVIGVEKCSAAFWVLFAVVFPVVTAMSAYSAITVRNEYLRKTACGFKFLPGDVVWDSKACIWYPVLCAVGGMATSLLGIGGAMFVNPLLLELGMNPMVVSATGAFTVLLTASSTSTQFAIAGAMQMDYGGWLWAVGFSSSLIGTIFVGKLVKKYQRASIIIFIICFVLAVSCVMMSVTGIMETVKRASAGASLGFLDYCT
eukprot:ANDGO_00518.mRNA.1 hypothetical protein NAEGRDRAFT_81115